MSHSDGLRACHGLGDQVGMTPNSRQGPGPGPQAGQDNFKTETRPLRPGPQACAGGLRLARLNPLRALLLLIIAAAAAAQRRVSVSINACVAFKITRCALLFKPGAPHLDGRRARLHCLQTAGIAGVRCDLCRCARTAASACRRRSCRRQSYSGSGSAMSTLD